MTGRRMLSVISAAIVGLVPLAARSAAAAGPAGHPAGQPAAADAELTPADVTGALEFGRGQLAAMANSGWSENTWPAMLWTTADAGQVPNTWQLYHLHVQGWIESFFPGSNWEVLKSRGVDAQLQSAAEKWTLSISQYAHTTGTHDVGFMFTHSFINAYALTGNPVYRDIALRAAASLDTRFDAGGWPVDAIKSWGSATGNPEFALGVCGSVSYPIAVDNMMNLELLLWAAEHGGPAAYRNHAIAHGRTTIRDHQRADGSTYHIVDYGPDGVPRKKCSNQGSGTESTWARGHSWFLHGMTVLYRYTRLPEFRDAAIRAADDYLARLPADGVTYNDTADLRRDSSAAAIAASALLELADYHPDATRGAVYLRAAEHTLHSLAGPPYRGDGTKAVIVQGLGSVYDRGTTQRALSFGDYYFLQALSRWAARYNNPVFSTADYKHGNRRSYTEATPSRWSLENDGGNIRYTLNTSSFQPPAAGKLGEVTTSRDNRATGDFRLTASIKAEDPATNPDADYAVVFGWTDPQNYRYVSFTPSTGGTSISSVVNGVTQVPYAYGTIPGIPDGGYNAIEVDRQACGGSGAGCTVSAYVNGVRVVTAADPGLRATGAVGFGSQDDRVWLDDVRLGYAFGGMWDSTEKFRFVSPSRWSTVDDGTSTRLRINQASQQLENGRPGNFALLGDNRFGDVTLTLDAKTDDAALPTADIVLLFDYQGWDDFNAVILSGSAAATQVVSFDGGVRTVVATAATPGLTSLTAWTRLTLQRRGPAVTVKRGSTTIFNGVSSALLSGGGRLGLGSLDSLARFDNIGHAG